MYTCVYIYIYICIHIISGLASGRAVKRRHRQHLPLRTPSSHSKNALSKIRSKGWVGLQGNTYTICANDFQGLGPKIP